MFSNHKPWLRAAAILQVLTAILHALSLFGKQTPTNETERQLMDLMENYRADMGAGFAPSFMELFTALSACFSLLCLFAGLQNLFFLRKNLDNQLLSGILNLNVLVFGICFLLMAFFTFLPPIVCTGLIFFTLIMARVFLPKKA